MGGGGDYSALLPQPIPFKQTPSGIGLGELFRRTEEVFTVEEKVQSRQVWTSFCTLLITLLVSWQIQRTFTVADQSSNYMYKSWADEIFKHAPNNSIILSRGITQHSF